MSDIEQLKEENDRLCLSVNYWGEETEEHAKWVQQLNAEVEAADKIERYRLEDPK